MRYLIIYDITDDNIRNAIAKRLLDYGMKRIQYSSFLGDLPRFKLNSLIIDLRDILFSDYGGDVNGDKNNGMKDDRRSILVYPLCDSCYSKGLTIDRGGRGGIRYICDMMDNVSGVTSKTSQHKHEDGDVSVI